MNLCSQKSAFCVGPAIGMNWACHTSVNGQQDGGHWDLGSGVNSHLVSTWCEEIPEDEFLSLCILTTALCCSWPKSSLQRPCLWEGWLSDFALISK